MKRKPSFSREKLRFILADMRQKAGLTQVELAERIGMPAHRGQILVSALEKGRSGNPDFTTVVLMVRACGVTLREFFERLESPELPEVDTTAIAQTDFSAAQKRKLERKLRNETYKYQSRARYPLRGRPMAPSSEQQATRRFTAWRNLVNIVEETVTALLDHLKFPKAHYIAYMDVARKFLGVLWRYAEPERSARMSDVLDYTWRWGLDAAVIGKIRVCVVKEYERFLRHELAAPQMKA